MILPNFLQKYFAFFLKINVGKYPFFINWLYFKSEMTSYFFAKNLALVPEARNLIFYFIIYLIYLIII
jgi:hemolysin-activating ACP:hemolysin acyltransferase